MNYDEELKKAYSEFYDEELKKLCSKFYDEAYRAGLARAAEIAFRYANTILGRDVEDSEGLAEAIRKEMEGE